MKRQYDHRSQIKETLVGFNLDGQTPLYIYESNEYEVTAVSDEPIDTALFEAQLAEIEEDENTLNTFGGDILAALGAPDG